MPTPRASVELYISKLNVNGQDYVIRDAAAQSEIKDIKEALEGGVHFRGISTTAIADGDALKGIETTDGEYYSPGDQHDGDMFIYNAGTAEAPKNLEFIVANGKYSELGSTGVLGALAFKGEAVGSVTLPLQTNITANPYTPQVGKGTLSVTTTTGTLDTSSVSTDAAIATTQTAATLGTTNAAATIDTEATAANVTTEATAATSNLTLNGVSVPGPAITITPTTGTFAALADVTYDEVQTTLILSMVTSDAFVKSMTVTAASQTITPTGSIAVTYDKTTAVTYDKIHAVTYVQVTDVTYDKTSAVTYDKVSASATFLTAASLEGDLAVTAAAPTLTITNPTVTVTVS